jgi:hypothetical protein
MAEYMKQQDKEKYYFLPWTKLNVTPYDIGCLLEFRK